MTEQEVLSAINFKKSCTLFALESSSEIADINASMVHFHGKPFSQTERMANYDKVTVKEVGDFAKTIAKETKFAVVAVGKDLKEEELMPFRQS